MRKLTKRPEWVLDLHWRDFEQLIAEIFSRNGFDVTLTAPSRDRGVDIYALRHPAAGSMLYVVECKHFRPDRPVGPNLVRQLRGVVDRTGATYGVLATTSFFTAPAREEEQELAFRLSLRDFEDIASWIAGEPLM